LSDVDNITHQIIRNRLAKLEATTDMEILYACESGSRSWGLASTDSDYDVRFIYRRPIESYLVLGNRRDVFEDMSDDHLYDMSGFDISKALALAGNSNPSVIEWMHSPIVYWEVTNLSERLYDILEDFSPQALCYHYASLAYRQYKAYWKGDEPLTLKKYLYAVRPISAVYWMQENEFKVPPINFQKLNPWEFMDLEESMELTQLLKIKRKGTEAETKGRYPALDKFIISGIDLCREAAKTAPTNQPDRQKLVDLYRESLFDHL
jgi:predicted nucleotidyltransferase